MKKLLFIIVSLLLSGCTSKVYSIDVFYIETCPRCHALIELLTECQKDYPIQLQLYNIDKEEQVNLYNQALSSLQDYESQESVIPLMIVDEYYGKIGYDSSEESKVIEDLDALMNDHQVSKSKDVYLFKERKTWK